MVGKRIKEAILENCWIDYFKDFDIYIDIELIVYMFCTKILFFKRWCEKIVKRGFVEGGITK